mmetsp:Transcript_26958/g.35845  ORF Transcript_26958/g.35845 Transcript_26958/m.35845 type:complete len:94 (-) Transcript_26958:838-1119(-)
MHDVMTDQKSYEILRLPKVSIQSTFINVLDGTTTSNRKRLQKSCVQTASIEKLEQQTTGLEEKTCFKIIRSVTQGVCSMLWKVSSKMSFHFFI